MLFAICNHNTQDTWKTSSVGEACIYSLRPLSECYSVLNLSNNTYVESHGKLVTRYDIDSVKRAAKLKKDQ